MHDWRTSTASRTVFEMRVVQPFTARLLAGVAAIYRLPAGAELRHTRRHLKLSIG